MTSRTHGESGQVIAIYAVAGLLVAFMTFVTLTIGVRVREKIKVQSTADAAAYGMAVGQARALNTLAWGNRAVVAEYVSMLSLASHDTYLNFYVATLKNAADSWAQIEGEFAAECAACWLVECLCPACDCISAANKARKVFQTDGPQGAQKCGNNCPGKFGSRDCAVCMWHSGKDAKKRHQDLEKGAVTYAGNAASVGDIMAKAANRYYEDMASGSQPFASALAQQVDPNMTAPSVGSGKSASQKQYFNAIWSDRAGPGQELASKSDMWDSYHEILTGTRTGFINNQSWSMASVETRDVMAAMQAMSQCGGFGATYTSVSGGSMVMKGEESDLTAVNHGHDHKYEGGGARGEGGRHAASAEDHGSTESFAYAGGCAFGAGYGSDKAHLFLSTNESCDQKSRHHDDVDSQYDDGDQNSGAPHSDWIKGVSSHCGGIGPGISTAFARFGLPTNKSGDTNEKTLWNQPRTYATLQKDITSDNPPGGRQPWDFNLDGIGGSLLTAKTKNVPTQGYSGHASEGTGKALQTTAFGSRFDLVKGMSAGLTYYHNPKSWQEVPNVWNPFWRAKLDQPYNGTSDLSGDDKAVAEDVFNY